LKLYNSLLNILTNYSNNYYNLIINNKINNKMLLIEWKNDWNSTTLEFLKKNCKNINYVSLHGNNKLHIYLKYSKNILIKYHYLICGKLKLYLHRNNKLGMCWT